MSKPSEIDSGSNSKKRIRRKVLSLERDNGEPFHIDEDDYLVVRELLPKENVTEVAKTEEGDGDYRVRTLNVYLSFKALPSPIGRLQNLKNLYCQDINSLPPSIGQLKKLEILEIESEYIGSLPHQIGDLTSLTHLDLSRCVNIYGLPSSIGRLQNLKHLNLYGMEHNFSRLPKEIGDLASLKRLNLGWVAITVLPSSIGRLKNLEDLDLSESSLSKVPKEIGDLVSLKKLNLNNTIQSALPPSIGRLQNLEELDLSSLRHLSTLPKNIGDLSSLKKLILYSSGITSLPLSMGRLHNLEYLDLSYASITSLPPSLGRLKNLYDLRLSGTRELSNLPEEIGDLSSLKKISLDGSRIASLPSSFGRLQNLEELYLPHTKTLPNLPEEIGNLTNLRIVSRKGMAISISSLPMFFGSWKCLWWFEFIERNSKEEIHLVGKNECDFLLMQTKRFKSLGSLGCAMDLKSVSQMEAFNAPNIKELMYALACNRARSRTGFGNTEDELIRMSPKLWPLLLNHARHAFKYARRYSNSRNGSIEFITKEDAIYQLLVDGRKSFVGVIINRKKNDVPKTNNED